MSLTLNLACVRPDNPDDPQAVRHIDGLHNRIWLDLVLCGGYPAATPAPH